MQRFRKFIPFWKIDEVKREVYGLVTAQLPDKEDEVCDYESTVPYYRALADEMGKATDGANICPLREMHQPSAVGKGIAFHPQDASKEILMAFKVVDDNAWKKVVEKVYTGFSQGGDYIRKWVQDGLTYYTANPCEVSLVDNPCLGAARFVYKMDGSCQLQKIGGADVNIAPDAEKSDLGEAVRLMNRIATKSVPARSTHIDIEAAIEQALRKFDLIKEAKTKTVAGVALAASSFAYVGDVEKTATWKLPIDFPGDAATTKRHIRNALARFSSTKGIPASETSAVKAKIEAAAKKQGIEVSEASEKAVRSALVKMLPVMIEGTQLAAIAPIEVAKGMYEVSGLARMLDELKWFVCASEYERDYEQDGSPVPDDLRDALETLVPIFIAMATEEATELTTAKADKGDSMNKHFVALFAALKALTAEDLAKNFKDVSVVELEKAAKSLHEHMDAMHKAVTDHHTAVCEHAEKGASMHKAHMSAMHGHIEKIRKAMGENAEEQGTGGSEHEGRKAQEAADLAKAEAEKVAEAAKAAEAKAKEDAAVLEAAKAAGNDKLVAMIAAMQKSIAETNDKLAKRDEALKAAEEKIAQFGNELEKHGPNATAPFLVGRSEQPMANLSTGTDRGL